MVVVGKSGEVSLAVSMKAVVLRTRDVPTTWTAPPPCGSSEFAQRDHQPEMGRKKARGLFFRSDRQQQSRRR